MHGSGFSPDHFTFPFVVRSCSVVSCLSEGREAHCNVIKHGFQCNVFVQSALLTMYAQNGEVSDSELAFGEMEYKNVVSWTSMIAGYAQNCFFEKAVDAFRSMVAFCIQPNEITLVSLLPALRGSGGLAAGMSLHAFAVKLGLEFYSSLMNALIAMYAKCGRKDAARFLFDGMPHRSLESWNTMIAMHEQSGEVHKSIKLFRTMLTEKVRFNSITLVSVISACASTEALETGKWVHKLAEKEGLEDDVRVGNALVDMYGRCGSLDSAKDVFDSLAYRGVVSWSAMIRAYAAHGNAVEALLLFAKMLAEGVRPNTFAYTSVLAACSHSGLVEEGLKHFYGMSDFGVTPTMEHCTCMVDLLGRAGKVVDAYELIKKMPMEPDVGVWGALLGACRIHGNLQIAESIAQELFQTGCKNETLFLLMANMYAEGGRWEDASRMRVLMAEMELKKSPGRSVV